MRRTALKRTGPLRAVSAKRAKQRPSLARWRALVLARGGYRCAMPGCDVVGPDRLHAHHVIPRSVRPDLLLDPENGRPLCPQHHDWVEQHKDHANWLGLYGFSYDTPAELSARYQRRTWPS